MVPFQGGEIGKQTRLGPFHLRPEVDYHLRPALRELNQHPATIGVVGRPIHKRASDEAIDNAGERGAAGTNGVGKLRHRALVGLGQHIEDPPLVSGEVLGGQRIGNAAVHGIRGAGK